MITRFIRGTGYFGRGLRLAFGRRELVPFVIAPGLIAAALTTAVVWYAAHALEQYFAHHPHGAFVGALMWLAVRLFEFAVGYLTYNVCCVLATAPFAGVLAERAQRIATGAAPPSSSWREAAGDMWRGINHTVLGALVYVAVAVPLFVLQWLVLPLAPFVWIAGLLQTALFFAFDAFNEPLHRERRSFGDKWRFVFRHGAESLGFGLAVSLCMMLPLVSLIVTPVSVVGGALLYVELRQKQLPPAV
jgi:CysZ protein